MVLRPSQSRASPISKKALGVHKERRARLKLSAPHVRAGVHSVCNADQHAEGYAGKLRGIRGWLEQRQLGAEADQDHMTTLRHGRRDWQLSG